jgi:hypothetical protein
MTAHVCPPCCHRCPDMDDDVMPGCLGTAALAANPRSLAWCTCQAALPAEGAPAAQTALLAARVEELERRLAELEAQQ